MDGDLIPFQDLYDDFIDDDDDLSTSSTPSTSSRSPLVSEGDAGDGETGRDELDPIDQYVERSGLAAMRQALHSHNWEEAERITEHLRPDARVQHEIDNGWRDA